jgi:amino acid permease
MAAKQAEMAKKMKKCGEDIAASVKQSFVDSINHTFKIASLIALFGALIALLFKNKEKIKKS